MAVGPTLVDWIATDTNELNPEEINEIFDSMHEASEYDMPWLRTDAIKDRDLLLSFADHAGGRCPPSGVTALRARVEPGGTLLPGVAAGHRGPGHPDL